MGALAAGPAEASTRIVTSPQRRQIVALSPHGGRPDVLLHIDGGMIVSPAASADGRRIAFIVQRDPRPSRDNPDLLVVRDEIWTMRGDGSGAHRILVFVRRKVPGHGYVFPPKSVPGGRKHIESLDISADGSKLVIDRGYSALYTLRADGSHIHYLRTAGAEVQGYVGSDCCGPQFAPGGRRIVGHFETKKSEGIGIVPARGGRVHMLTRGGFSASYSDDGRRIAFVAAMPPPKAHPRSEGDWAIWLMRSDGTGAHVAVRRKGRSFVNPDFSPDGRWLTFSSIVSAGDGLINVGKDAENTYVVRLDGSRLHRVGRGVAGFNYGNPQWVR